MIGAIAGDMVGSVYEHQPIKIKDFPLFSPRSCFTDDSVLTVAVASAILNKTPYAETVRQIGCQYPNAGYGGSFIQWLAGPSAGPYHSWGNGAAMRVSPVGFAFTTETDVLAQAQATAEITHNHPEGIKGAQATALAVFLARTGADKRTIREAIVERFDYDLARTLEEIRPSYRFDVSCQGSVPEAIIAFLEADSYEDAVRNAVSLGGDSDTQACIAGGIAEAFYGGVPDDIRTEVEQRLTPDLWAVTDTFCQQYR
ncbi:ADP-ribosylglycohydrolase family protein [Halomonas vilamensis]|uniref:ADP-ribosylglycohydrolase family protein n=1 Tax=Vreelandella vilamensis TaxID=531309 RepID=A0ABU1H1H5_9GAMM|nr:ADP-ribosylglycohydrolase family protein [Halomonas vilamensis]MDR5897617.1 ADP-ribosylglycohydrolase family protein [Halomonas vilamensis]